MLSYPTTRTRVTTVLCTLLLLLPVVTQAASNDEISVMRAQLMALSDRLDRLEAENRELAAANVELAKSQQNTAATVVAVSEKTDAVATEIKDQSKSQRLDRNHALERRLQVSL